MNKKLLTGDLLDDDTELSLEELCRACSGQTDWIIGLVEHGVLEPSGSTRTEWRFSAVSLHRVSTAMRLQHDLDINLAGVALALDLLDEIETLRAHLGRIERDTET